MLGKPVRLQDLVVHLKLVWGFAAFERFVGLVDTWSSQALSRVLEHLLLWEYESFVNLWLVHLY